MRDPEGCDHDWRRVFPGDIRSEWRNETRVHAVLCCHCGISPVRILTHQMMASGAYRVNGDWPADHKITAIYDDEVAGPSVEFEIVSDPQT